MTCQLITDSSMRQEVGHILCKSKFHSIKTSKTEVKGKTWQKLAKVDKSWQELEKLEKTAKVGNSFQKLSKFGKNAKNCHKFLVEYSWAATIYATRYPTRYPDFFLLPYPNPTQSKKTLPVTAWWVGVRPSKFCLLFFMNLFLYRVLLSMKIVSRDITN